MKKNHILLLFFIFTTFLKGQDKKEESKFWNKILIGESMETAEQKESPAQIQITLPKKDSTSWLVNVGVSYDIASSVRNFSKIEIEYHKNTLTDKKQNNFQTGYGLTHFFSENPSTFFLNADAKYVYDGVDVKNSIASNLLFSYYGDGDDFKFNTLLNRDKKSFWFLSGFAGTQLQGIIKAKDEAAQGFIVRPLYVLGIQYNFTNKPGHTSKPIFRLWADYTGRYDLINSTSYQEKYTHLFKTGGDIFIAYWPVKVSVGASFNYGSDPIKGLRQQQFWLISLNFSRGRE